MKSSNKKIFLAELLTKYLEEVNNLNKDDIPDLIELDLYDLLYIANRIRQKYCGNKIKFCSIINAKSGNCSEDCKYCAQSVHFNTNPNVYDIKEPEEVLNAALDAQRNGVPRFCIVTSGRGILNDNDWEKIYKTIRLLKKETSLTIEASLGCLDKSCGQLLKNAGLTRYNHNLETSPKFFPNICTTHAFLDRLNTVKAVKDVGLEVCCGGLFGMGETWDDRVELASILKDINPDSIPLNFLHPRPGTPFENLQPLRPQEILRIIAVFRIILPDKDLSVCGGREKNLRSLQSWMFYAGANATMLGNYLTTIGNPPENDLQMLKDLELCPELS
jgi:biotin synthase